MHHDLFNSMSEALLREDIHNRLAGVVNRKDVEGHIAISVEDGKWVKLKLAQVEGYNKQAIFPTLRLHQQKIEMQSGQHRKVVSAELKQGNMDEWWWIVDLYDHSKDRFHRINCLEIYPGQRRNS